MTPEAKAAATEIYRGHDVKLTDGTWVAVNADGNTVAEARSREQLYEAVDAHKRAQRAVAA